MTQLRLFNSLTRQLEPFEPLQDGKARVYTCGPTVYADQHIGNMRAYIFADTLGRALSWAGYDLRHVVNITDVGHLTSDADAGEDKMERAAEGAGESAWDIARRYQQRFERDCDRLNIRKPEHPRATDHVAAMIEWIAAIEDTHCYRLDSGLYFDVSTVPDYGALAGAASDLAEGRIDSVEGKRHPADFALWRTTPPGETRQMEWDSPWGRGAPGWHIECSVMSAALLGQPFDIHTGGIDHREIHHPNEIAQNQAKLGARCGDTGAKLWMHNNFLVDRRGKMSKSSGEFLTLQALIDRGYHPLAYRLMCLQAHYRSELEFTWEGLHAALVRLKRLSLQLRKSRDDYHGTFPAERALAPGTPSEHRPLPQPPPDQPQQVRKVVQEPRLLDAMEQFDAALSNDLNTATALTVLEDVLAMKKVQAGERGALSMAMLAPLGLGIPPRADLRIRPEGATIDDAKIEAALTRRTEARAAKDFATSDAIRDELAAQGVEVMDGDPLGWDWKLDV